MGAWGHKSLENDQALDWIDSLVKAKAKKPISQAIRRAISIKDPDADVCNDAIAAAEVIAYSRGHGAKDLRDNLREWVEDVSFSANDDLAKQAQQALQAILEKFDLAELRREDDAQPWRRVVKRLIDRLARPSKPLPRLKTPLRTTSADQKAAFKAIRKAGGDVYFEKRVPLTVWGHQQKHFVNKPRSF